MKRCRVAGVVALAWLLCGAAVAAQGLSGVTASTDERSKRLPPAAGSLGVAPPKSASQAPPPQAEQRGDLAVGYAFIHDVVAPSWGFYASGSWRLSQAAAFVTETQLEHGSRDRTSLNLFTLEAGLRFSGGSESSRSIRGFGQVLAGVVHGTDLLAFALQPGFGVDLGITPGIALRPQVDGLIFLGGRIAGQTKKDVRFSVGVVFRLSK